MGISTKNINMQNIVKNSSGTPLDSLLGGNNAPTKEEIEIVEKVKSDTVNISTTSLKEYHNHTFKVKDDNDMVALKESIKLNGIMLPLIVRKTNESNVYEIISGHRRHFAAKAIGLKEVPCKVVDIDDATADIMMVDTNLHREEILPSEKAKSLEIKLNALKTKGLVSDEDSMTEAEYISKIAEDTDMSFNAIYKYKGLLRLIAPLLELVDEKAISVNAGYILSSLSENDQNAIILAEPKSISIDQANKIKTASKNPLTADIVNEILGGKLKPRASGKSKFKAVSEKKFIKNYPEGIKNLPPEKRESFLADCIKEYISNHSSWGDVEL